MFSPSLRRHYARFTQSLLRQHAGQCNFSVTALRLKDKNTGSIQHVDYESKYAAKLSRRAAE